MARVATRGVAVLLAAGLLSGQGLAKREAPPMTSPGTLVSKLACPPGAAIGDFMALVAVSEEDSWEGPSSAEEAVSRLRSDVVPGGAEAVPVPGEVTEDEQLLAVFGSDGPLAYFLAERVWDDWVVTEFIHCTEFVDIKTRREVQISAEDLPSMAPLECLDGRRGPMLRSPLPCRSRKPAPRSSTRP